MVIAAFPTTHISYMVIKGLDGGRLGGEFRFVIREIARTIPSLQAVSWRNWIIFRVIVLLPANYLLQINTFPFSSIDWKSCSLPSDEPLCLAAVASSLLLLHAAILLTMYWLTSEAALVASSTDSEFATVASRDTPVASSSSSKLVSVDGSCSPENAPVECNGNSKFSPTIESTNFETRLATGSSNAETIIDVQEIISDENSVHDHASILGTDTSCGMQQSLATTTAVMENEEEKNTTDDNGPPDEGHTGNLHDSDQNEENEGDSDGESNDEDESSSDDDDDDSSGEDEDDSSSSSSSGESSTDEESSTPREELTEEELYAMTEKLLRAVILCQSLVRRNLVYRVYQKEKTKESKEVKRR